MSKFVNQSPEVPCEIEQKRFAPLWSLSLSEVKPRKLRGQTLSWELPGGHKFFINTGLHFLLNYCDHNFQIFDYL
jgi:hypothetical protein